jgi:hypothetical protein
VTLRNGRTPATVRTLPRDVCEAGSVATRPASEWTIRRRAAEVFGLEVLSAEQLARRLEAVGVELGPDGEDRLGGVLDGSSAFVELEAGWVAVGAQLDGTAWSTAVSADDAKAGVLAVDPDLTLLGWWAMDVTPGIGPSGDVVETVELDDGSDGLMGPPGWLDEAADRVVVVRIEGQRVLLEALDGPPEVTPAQADALRTTFESQARRDELESSISAAPSVTLVNMMVEDLLWEALAAHREAFTSGVNPPLDLMLEAAGLERRDHTVAATGFDWAALARWHRRNKLARFHHLADRHVDAAELLLGASEAVIDDDLDALGPAGEEARGATFLAVCLADPPVARAFWGEHVERDTSPDDLVRFARRLLDHVDGTGSGGPSWLAGRALDVAGDPVAAEATLESAVASGDEHPLALAALASFRADRGDAPGALRLLRRAQVDDDDELLGEIAGFARYRPSRTVGRNDPCPCGSGRKYKVCHLGREAPPLIDRAGWLYAKARRYLRDNRHRRLVAEIASTVRRASGRDAFFLVDLLDSELVADLALCEAGVFDDFLAERHAMLPDDEALLAGSWQLVDRSLFEIERVQSDRLALRDVRTAERLTVTNTHPSDHTRPGLLMLGRPLPVEDTWRAYSGFVPVRGALVDELLTVLDDPDPFDLAELIGRCLAPPAMSNTDGEPLVFHELTYRLPDPSAARAALAASTLHTDGDDTFTLVRDTKNQPDTLIATFAITGDQLAASVNSDARLAEAQDLVARLLPDAELVDHDQRDLDEMLAEAEASPERAAPRSSDDDPVLAAALEQHIRKLERRWVDEPVPALGGRTPRDAAQDPIGRHELERLLASFDDGVGSPGAMNANRIRALLDLNL